MVKHAWTLLTALAVAAGCMSPVATREPQPPPPGDPHPVFSGLLTFAGGSYSHDTEGSALDDDTSGGFFRLVLEGNSHAGFGGGLLIEGASSEDDLFSNVGGAERAEGSWGEVAPYFMYRVASGNEFRMPLRIGIYFQSLGLEGQVTGSEIDWDTSGLRFAAEPEFVLSRSGEVEFSLAGELILGLGSTDIQATVGGPTADFESNAGTFGLEFGPRLRISAFTAGLSLLHRTIVVDDSDPVGGVFLRGVEASFTGIALTLGVRL